MAEFKSMPSYFKQTKKRKTGPKTTTFKKVKAAPQTVVVYRSVPTETKYYMNNDWTAETLDDRVTGASFNFNLMRLAQGTGTGQRVGSQVQAKGLSIKLITRQGTTLGQEFNRIDFWMDTQPNAANATWGALYDGGATRLDEINATITEAARKRFRLLRSLVFNHRNFLTSSTGPVVSPDANFAKVWIPLKGRRIHYDGSAAGNPDGGCNVFAVGWGTVSADTTRVYMMSNFSFQDV